MKVLKPLHFSLIHKINVGSQILWDVPTYTYTYVKSEEMEVNYTFPKDKTLRCMESNLRYKVLSFTDWANERPLHAFVLKNINFLLILKFKPFQTQNVVERRIFYNPLAFHN